MPKYLPLILFLSALIGLAAVSRDSLWIDEAYSEKIAEQPTLQAWWHTLSTDTGSDTQMPVYMIFLWAWEKVAGRSEFALRSANIPLFLVAQAALLIGFSQFGRKPDDDRGRPSTFQIALVCCAAADPFVWSYLNEARPYIMEYSGACLVVSCLAWAAAGEYAEISFCWIAAYGLGLLLLSGGSALGIAWAGASVAGFLCLVYGRLRVRWNVATLVTLAGTVSVMALLAGYYYWTVRRGARAAPLPSSPLNVPFATYEILGFAGLGPGRLVIRSQGPAAMREYILFLIPLAACLAVVIVAGLQKLRQAGWRVLAAGTLYVVLPLSAVLTLSFLTPFALLGRHLMPTVPAIVVICALGMDGLLATRRPWAIAWTVAFQAIWIVSALSLRFAPRHRRDDYRNAAAIARAELAAHHTVWWAASVPPGEYYGLIFTFDPNQRDKALVIWQPQPADVHFLPLPDYIILSKPLLFDSHGALAAYLAEHHFVAVEFLPAFSIWTRK